MKIMKVFVICSEVKGLGLFNTSKKVLESNENYPHFLFI